MDIRKLFSAATAFIVPFPIYYSTFQKDIFAANFDPAIVSIDKNLLGQMVPVGFFLFSLFWSIQFLRLVKRRSSFTVLLLISSALLVFLGQINIIYKLILISGVLFLYFFNEISNLRFLKVYAQSYCAGVVCVLSLNFLSFLYVTPDFADLRFARNLLGYEIYSYLVTYSAVSSLWLIGAVCFLAHNGQYRVQTDRMTMLISFVTALGVWTILCTARKAALLDLFFVGVTWVYFVIRFDWKRGKLFRRHLAVAPLVACAFVIASHVVTSRDISLDSTMGQRAGPYIQVLDKAFGGLEAFLFGFDAGFGGYSNVVLELIARSGLVGLLVYTVLLIISARKFLRSLFQSVASERRDQIFARHLLLAFGFSLFVGNMANLNIGNPYYVVNLFSLLMVIRWWFGQNKSALEPVHAASQAPIGKTLRLFQV